MRGRDGHAEVDCDVAAAHVVHAAEMATAVMDATRCSNVEDEDDDDGEEEEENGDVVAVTTTTAEETPAMIVARVAASVDVLRDVRLTFSCLDANANANANAPHREDALERTAAAAANVLRRLHRGRGDEGTRAASKN